MTVISWRGGRLTPDQVSSAAFPPSRLGRRGFDEEHVRAFCAQVEREMVTLLNEKAAMWEEVRHLRRQVHGENGGPAPAPPRQDAHTRALLILSKAQQTADRYVADAQAYSRDLAEDARRRRDEVLMEARAHAARVLGEAHQQASQAASAAVSGRLMPPASPGPADLQTELAYLRTFSDVHRTHLRAYLEALLRNVEEWDQAERPALPAPLKLAPPLPRVP